MTPTHLAAYIAHGPSGLHAFDLPAVLDALKTERAAAWAQRDRPNPSECRTIHAVNRLDAAIARIEHFRNPTPDTTTEVQHTAERVAYDVCACIDHGETP